MRGSDASKAFTRGARCEEQGRWADAERHYRQAATAGSSGVAWYSLGQVIKKSGGRAEEATDCFRKAYAAGAAYALYELWLAAQAAGDDEETERLFAAGALAGQSFAARFPLVEQERARRGAAWEYFRAAIEAGSAEAMWYHGLIATEAGRTEEGQSWFRRALQAGETRARDFLSAP